MLTKLKPKLMPIWAAVVKQRVAVLIVLAIGLLVALLAPVAPPLRYVAAHDVSIANVTVPGFDPPCSAAALPAFAKSSDVANQFRLRNNVALDPSTVSTQLLSPGVMAIRYTGLASDTAKTSATHVAQAVVAVCNADTTAMLATLGTNLAALQDRRQADLRAVDAQLVPASRDTSQQAALSKRLDALNAQRIDAEQKLAVQKKLAESAEKQKDDARRLAAREISGSDSLSNALRAQRDKDMAALAAARAQYQDGKYPGLAALERRVQKDEAASIQRNNDLTKYEPQTLSPAFRAAQNAADQARGAAAAQAAQVEKIKAQIAPLNAEIASLDSVAVAVASNTLKRDALLKAYQAAAAQRYALDQQKEQVVARPAPPAEVVGDVSPIVSPALGDVSGPLALAASPEPGVETLGKKLALAVRAAVLLAFVVLAAIVALVLNALDRRLLTVEAITQLYGKPVISTLGPQSHV